MERADHQIQILKHLTGHIPCPGRVQVEFNSFKHSKMACAQLLVEGFNFSRLILQFAFIDAAGNL